MVIIKCHLLNVSIFRHDCDEIRPKLRNDLLKDSKLCQLEQIKDQKQRDLMMKDFDNAWHEIQSRDYIKGLEKDKLLNQCRWHYNQSVQEFQKSQMVDKAQRELKVFDEINEERKQISQLYKENYEMEQEQLRAEKKLKKTIGDAVLHQIRENYQIRKKNLNQELKTDQAINEKIRKDLEVSQIAEKTEKEQFRRDVYNYLDQLMIIRHHNKNVESEKEKLIADIQAKHDEDSWKSRCDTYQKRLLVNQNARRGQVQQIKIQEQLMFEEAAKTKHENSLFNERERLERLKIKESKWQQRVKAFNYGRELMEQRKSEELRDATEKQLLNETLMLASQERERCEMMGLEFVKSHQDVLPLHPNLIIIQRGKHN